MYQKQGDSRSALTQWTRIAREAQDPNVKRIAENRARALKTDLDVAALQDAVTRFHAVHGAYPRVLAQLQVEAFLPTVPLTLDGEPYRYDPATGTVNAGPARVITN